MPTMRSVGIPPFSGHRRRDWSLPAAFVLAASTRRCWWMRDAAVALAFSPTTPLPCRCRRGASTPHHRPRGSGRTPASPSLLCALFLYDAAAFSDRAPALSSSSLSSFYIATTTTTMRTTTTTGASLHDLTGWSPPRAGDVARWNRIDGPTDGPPPPYASSSTVLAAAATSTPDRPPTDEEVGSLQRAFSSYYGPPAERDLPAARELLGECIDAWVGSHQGGDEVAGLYRVRGDLDMVRSDWVEPPASVLRPFPPLTSFFRAIDRPSARPAVPDEMRRQELRRPMDAVSDYSEAIRYLEGPDGIKADPEELPASR